MDAGGLPRHVESAGFRPAHRGRNGSVQHPVARLFGAFSAGSGQWDFDGLHFGQGRWVVNAKLILSRAMASRRRNTRAEDPKLRETGSSRSDPDYEGGLPSEAPSPYAALALEGSMEKVDLHDLAKHLRTELDAFIRHGAWDANEEEFEGHARLTNRHLERIRPALLAYAESVRERRRLARGHRLARFAVMTATRPECAERAFKWVLHQRGGQRWSIPWKDPGESSTYEKTVTTGIIETIALSGKDRFNKAAAIYNALADGWGFVEPQGKKATDKNQPNNLRPLLERYLKHIDRGLLK